MRYAIAIVVLLGIIAGLGGIKFQQISSLIAAGKAMEKAGPPPESVGTALAKEDRWEQTLVAVGTVTAARGVTVSNEAPGVVTAIRFESGEVVRAGQVLVELDTSVERAQLASLEARKELAAVSAGRSKVLLDKAAIAQSQFDGDQAQFKTSRADVGALQAQIERKTVRAPFAGRLGIRTVNLGQYLNPGTAVTVLSSLGTIYVDFTLPQQQMSLAPIRTPVRATVAGLPNQTFEGVVAAVDPTLDAATRAVKLRASVANLREQLRPGMFVNVQVVLPQAAPVVVAPATAVVHASFGDSVFVVEEQKDAAGAPVSRPDGKPGRAARQQFVKLGESRGDFVSFLDGVKPGQELVTVGAFKLRNGAAININNNVGPTPQQSPHPDNH